MNLLRLLFLFLLSLTPFTSEAWNIILSDISTVTVDVISNSEKEKLIKNQKGQIYTKVWMNSISRIYSLADSTYILDCYDRQGIHVKSRLDLNKLQEVQFIKTYIDFLKRNISYKITGITNELGNQIAARSKRVDSLSSEGNDQDSYKIYEMANGQMLVSYKTDPEIHVIYENIKALASELKDIEYTYYKGMDEWTIALVNGDRLKDYTYNDHLVYPSDLPTLILNHKLTQIESKIYVSEFYGDLYKSANGYYVLIDHVNQENGAGPTMIIVTVRLYDSIEEVRLAQKKYKERPKTGTRAEPLFKFISDKYGKNFPKHVPSLLDSIPAVLNHTRGFRDYTPEMMSLLETAIFWNFNEIDYRRWFPSVLAYFGEYCIRNNEGAYWKSEYDELDKIWIPKVYLKDGNEAFDSREFAKRLYEWPVPLIDLITY